MVIRALRKRAGLRQADIAARAEVSQSLVSLVERGHLEQVAIRTLRHIVQPLGADIRVMVFGPGADGDRLLDHRHAALCQRVAKRLARWGWEVRVEVSYSEWGERGAIDLLAWHPATRWLLVIEVKSRLGSMEATLRKLDEKTRLAPTIARKAAGWQVRGVSRVLVMPAGHADRALLQRHAALVRGSLPLGSNAIRRWIRNPTDEPAAGTWFLAPERRGDDQPRPRRRSPDR